MKCDLSHVNISVSFIVDHVMMFEWHYLVNIFATRLFCLLNFRGVIAFRRGCVHFHFRSYKDGLFGTDFL